MVKQSTDLSPNDHDKSGSDLDQSKSSNLTLFLTTIKLFRRNASQLCKPDDG